MPQLRVFVSALPPLTDPTGAGHPHTTVECCKHPQKAYAAGRASPKDSWTKASDSARDVFVEFPTGNGESRAAELPHKKLRRSRAAYGEMGGCCA